MSIFGMEFLNPGRLWWLLAVAGAGDRLRRRPAAGGGGRRCGSPQSTCSTASPRTVPGGAATSSPGCSSPVWPSGSSPSPARSSATTERTESEGRIVVLFDVSLSMMATDVDPSRLEAAKQAARDFVDQVDAGHRGRPDLVQRRGDHRGRRRRWTARRSTAASTDLELAESTAIGDALVSGTRLLTDLAEDSDSDDSDAGHSLPVRSCCCPTARPPSAGRPPEGGEAAAEAGVPVFTIAFGTADGAITDPVSGETIPVPVQPEPLDDVAETTGGAGLRGGHGRPSCPTPTTASRTPSATPSARRSRRSPS